jgi:hypothetical protein
MRAMAHRKLCVSHTHTVATLCRYSGVLNVIVEGGLVCIVPAWPGTLRAFVVHNENHRQTVNFKRENWRTSSQWAIRSKECYNVHSHHLRARERRKQRINKEAGKRMGVGWG